MEDKTVITMEVQYKEPRIVPGHKHSVTINGVDLSLEDIVFEIKGLLLAMGYQQESLNEYFTLEE